MPKPDNTLPGEKKEGKIPSQEERREGEYVKPTGDISPGAHPGTIAPTEDPRTDSGIEEEQPEATPKKK